MRNIDRSSAQANTPQKKLFSDHAAEQSPLVMSAGSIALMATLLTMGGGEQRTDKESPKQSSPAAKNPVDEIGTSLRAPKESGELLKVVSATEDEERKEGIATD